ncbi:MAG: hypothetical protein AB7W16_13390 [Candidatus Obscuribacterales bacterium]
MSFIRSLAVVLAISSVAWLPAEASSSFSEVNEIFHGDYKKAKEELKGTLGPVIIVSGDTITLVRDGKEESEVFIKDRYTVLKEVSHITLGTFVILTNHTDRSLDEETAGRLKRFRDAIAGARSSLAERGLEGDQLARQERLIERTLAFQDRVLADNRVSAGDLKSYTRSVARDDLDNAFEAVSSQLASMDEIVSRWRQTMGEEAWKRLHVIVGTGHMPRERLAALQFFFKLLKVSREGKQVVTIESAADHEAAIDLLVTHMLDQSVAVDFFGDSWRMHRDLLSDGAAAYLRRHPPGRAGKGQ